MIEDLVIANVLKILLDLTWGIFLPESCHLSQFDFPYILQSKYRQVNPPKYLYSKRYEGYLWIPTNSPLIFERSKSLAQKT